MRFELSIQLNSLTFLLGVNLLVYLLVFLISSGGMLDPFMFFALGGHSSALVISGDLISLVTANFLHYQFLHFALNIYSLYVIGKIVHALYGGKILFVTYIFGGIASGLLTTLVSLGTSTEILSLGASGSIFALLGLLIGGSLKKNRFGFDLPYTLRDILPFAILSLVFGFVPGSNINNWAHIGGLLCGILIGMSFPAKINMYFEKRSETIINIFFVISQILFAVAYILLVFRFFQYIY